MENGQRGIELLQLYLALGRGLALSQWVLLMVSNALIMMNLLIGSHYIQRFRHIAKGA